MNEREYSEWRAGEPYTYTYDIGHFEKTEEEVFFRVRVELKNGPYHEDITLDYAT